jgi:DNA-binding MarR family transcriptional regulator
MSVDLLRKVLELLPPAYHRIGASGDLLHAPLRLSSGMRGLLVSLERMGPTSVPRLAAMRPVSRQFVQKLVDEMVLGGWVIATPNPAHKRSPLIELTPKGRDAIKQMYAVEQPYLTTLSNGLDANDLAIVARVLAIICERISPEALEQLAGDLATAQSLEPSHG